MPKRIMITADYTVIDHTGNLDATIGRMLDARLADCEAINISVKYVPDDDDADA